MGDYLESVFLEKLKEIYTLIIEVIDIAPDKDLCNDEMIEVLSDIYSLRESFYLIEDVFESKDLYEAQPENVDNFNCNKECILSLFRYLERNGYIVGNENEKEKILSNMFNMPGEELLEGVDWNEETKDFFIYLGVTTTEMCEELIQCKYTIEEYIDLINRSGGNLKAAHSLTELSDFLSGEEFMNDNWPALWDYPLEEKEYCMNGKIPVVLVENNNECRYFEVPEESFIHIFNKILGDKRMEQMQYLVQSRNINNQKSLDKLVVEAEKKHNLNINELEKQNNIIDATFISVWDDGFCIETTCKVNLLTREIFDIEENEKHKDYVNILNREFVRLEDGTEFNVEQDLNGDLFLSSINRESIVDNMKRVSVNNEGYVTVCRNPTMKSR